MLRYEYAFAELEELLRIRQLLVHDALAYSVEDDANHAADRDDDRGVETDDRQLHGISEERADDLLVVEQYDQVLLFFDLLLGHLCLLLLSELLVDFARGLLALLGSVLYFDFFLAIS